jgi:hypothetical protein
MYNVLLKKKEVDLSHNKVVNYSIFLYSPQLKGTFCYNTCNCVHLILKASFILFPSHLLKLFWTPEIYFLSHFYDSGSLPSLAVWLISWDMWFHCQEDMNKCLHNEVPTDTGTSCQWHIQICTGHMKIMSKNKLAESKHRSLLLYGSLEVFGALWVGCRWSGVHCSKSPQCNKIIMGPPMSSVDFKQLSYPSCNIFSVLAAQVHDNLKSHTRKWMIKYTV